MRNVLKQHFRNLSLQKGLAIKPQKRQLLAHAAVEVEKCVAEMRSVYLLAKYIFVHMRRNGQGLADFGKVGFPKIGGSNKSPLQRITRTFSQ